ncbi:TlpA family protein disulfide reductase [Flavobacterium salilacus subsp. salilacus]|uniref:TlpA family protein disulfide reductase n=1 Tax=Flavobacterium TaxID=237 RepID=UPI00107564C9|nr:MULTISPECIES: TlpA disulfide reductase family protein [Flavobacterium]KAF2517533.1 TlpA family protein disulfide reductase [Flavobacterium salilacus subsp. salilacus]MBE1615681.1 TlpA family protein disulfide reductase [Flavobacterium sp. SaA2.13]NDI99755.1 TlpA family protein disulfide reductase [Flavobacterium salilacus subsp. altitudinum]
MKKILLLPLLLITITACTEKEAPTTFSEATLNSKMKYIETGTEMPFKDVLDKYKGNVIVIDVWASWCPDCAKGMPKVHKLQEQFPDIVYLFLSYDKTPDDWKTGIDKFEVKGEHYYIGHSEYKNGDFRNGIELDWIPRYIVVDKESNIALYRAIEADDEKLIATLNTLEQ